MQIKYVLFAVLILGGISLAIFLYSVVYPQAGKYPTTPDCEVSGIGGDKLYTLCCDNGRMLAECEKDSLKCNQFIRYEINVSRLAVPESFFICADTLKFGNAPDLANQTSVVFRDYDKDGESRTFSCYSQPWDRNRNLVLWYGGTIPNVVGKRVLARIYVFATNVSYEGVNDFLSRKNNATEIFSLEGAVRC